MKNLVLLLVLMLIVPAIAHADDKAQFKIDPSSSSRGSDGAGFSVIYSWPGEGKEPMECTVTVRVQYSKNGDKNGGTEDFKFTNKIHNTGSGWAYFDGKTALDKSALLDVSIIQGNTCP